MPDATPRKCSLSPVNDKAVLLNFDGVETISNAGLMLLATIEQRLGLPVHLLRASTILVIRPKHAIS